MHTHRILIRHMDPEQDIIAQSKGMVDTDRIKEDNKQYNEYGLMSVQLFGDHKYRCNCEAATVVIPTEVTFCQTCSKPISTRMRGIGSAVREEPCGCKHPRPITVEEEDYVCSKCGLPKLSESIRDNCRSFIKLTTPILSPILAGIDGGLLKRILGLTGNVISEVCHGRTILDKQTGEFVKKGSARNDVNGYYYSGEVAKEYWIPSFDFDMATCYDITKKLHDKFVSSTLAPIGAAGMVYNRKTLRTLTLPSGKQVFLNPSAVFELDDVKFGDRLQGYLIRGRAKEDSVTTTGFKYLWRTSMDGEKIFNKHAYGVLNLDVLIDVFTEAFKASRRTDDEKCLKFLAEAFWTLPKNGTHRDIFFEETTPATKLFKDFMLVRSESTSLPEDETVIQFLLSEVKEPLKRLPLLLNGNISKLEKMIIEHVRVTPPNTRPEINGRHDPFTKMYADLVKVNKTIDILGKNATVEDRASKVGKLYVRLCELFAYDNKSDAEDLNQKSVISKLSHKRGLIRRKMLGKRVDYSARSVIVGDPTLKIGECSLPFEVCKVIFQWHLKQRGVDINNETQVRKRLESDILQTVPVLLNRAPTLHRLGFLGFWVKMNNESAIGLHPLVCSGFNADFDGDQMAVHVPLSEAAVQEVTYLMMSDTNIYVPASGKITLVPSQEMLYGLNVLTKERDPRMDLPQTECETVERVYNDVIKQILHVDQVVRVGSICDLAGKVAFYHCIPRSLWSSVPVITNSNIDGFMNLLASTSIDNFKEAINKIMKIAFAVATIYAPKATIFSERKNNEDPFAGFLKEMEPYNEAYANGFLCADHYNQFYSTKYEAVKKNIEDGIIDYLGEENGYCQMVLSGARGTKSTLSQVFVSKGLIKKDNERSFNVVIRNGHLAQLSSIEHFIAAFGARYSLIEKTKKTSDTGYASRQMNNAFSPLIIQSNDCGTSKYITISKNTMRRSLNNDESKVTALIAQMLTGRCLENSSRYLTQQEATGLAEDSSKEFYHIRSPLTCEDPCCSKCYGVDLTTLRAPMVGTPIGFIAAQAIGEIGTQLTMRTFHGGGVATKTSITSAFDVVNSLMSFAKRTSKNWPTYDPMAWADGEVIVFRDAKGIKIKIGDDPRLSAVLPAEAIVKEGEYVTKGEGLCKEQGDFDPHEVFKYQGLDAALQYLLYSMFFCYVSQKSINFKHFECLVYSMNRYVVYESNDPYFKVGQNMSKAEYINYRPASVLAYPTIVGVDKVSQGTIHGLSQLTFERLGAALKEIAYNENDDALTLPINRAALGLPPLNGTYYPNYLSERASVLNREALI